MKFVLQSALLATAAMLAISAYAGTPAAPTAPASAITPNEESSASVPEPSHLYEGMPYIEARTRLLAQGWHPVRSPQCLRDVWNMGGNIANYKTCKPKDSRSECHVCSRFPELRSCFGDGGCQSIFQRDHDFLYLEFDAGGIDINTIKDGAVTDWGDFITRSRRGWPPKRPL